MTIRRTVSTGVLVFPVILLILFAGCTGLVPTDGSGISEEEITVFSAASLTGAITDLSGLFEEKYPGTVVIHNFDNSNALRTQIEHGAKADIFISADMGQMTALLEKGCIDEQSVVIILENALAVIIPVENPASITEIRDLGYPGVRLVIGADGTPFGRYTREILEKYRDDPQYGSVFVDTIYSNIVSEEMSVGSVMPKIILGEADAAFLYKSDILKRYNDQVIRIEIPEAYNVVARYPAGILKESANKNLAEEYVNFLTGPEGGILLREYGFDPTHV
ncbi:molybdate ABC transporter substrate-binding protein [Methanocalculus sp.]|uniref:molybdate ABC transporter substrate-binding protein n=1 Tax=Methanocalculus sp. TaxID=2004547 RepID=UPI00272647A5|nr:molybdate ABC transporter substrate-binding protein [Methanocalculus sp.]MDO8841204.1 molybdate ABC transporter substrate-binding protein [Methanocalculus sp.]